MKESGLELDLRLTGDGRTVRELCAAPAHTMPCLINCISMGHWKEDWKITKSCLHNWNHSISTQLKQTTVKGFSIPIVQQKQYEVDILGSKSPRTLRLWGQETFFFLSGLIKRFLLSLSLVFTVGSTAFWLCESEASDETLKCYPQESKKVINEL